MPHVACQRNTRHNCNTTLLQCLWLGKSRIYSMKLAAKGNKGLIVIKCLQPQGRGYSEEVWKFSLVIWWATKYFNILRGAGVGGGGWNIIKIWYWSLKWGENGSESTDKDTDYDDDINIWRYFHYSNKKWTNQHKWFPYSYRNTSGSKVRRNWSGNTNPQSECFHTISSSPKLPYFFCEITRRKLKRKNNLYQSTNSPYCSRWRMWFRIMARSLHVFDTVNRS